MGGASQQEQSTFFGDADLAQAKADADGADDDADDAVLPTDVSTLTAEDRQRYH